MNDVDRVKQEEAVQTQEELPQVTMDRKIPHRPVPMSWNFNAIRATEGPAILVTIQTPEGDKVFFLAPSIARQIGEVLTNLSAAIESVEAAAETPAEVPAEEG